MKIFHNINELVAYRNSLNKSVGFVPTMGALHNGHLSLIKQSIKENEHTIVSIFVNPTQFLENEDLSKYPRQEEKDIKICSLAGVDAVFMPDVSYMYTKSEPSIKAPQSISYILEGFERPSHFDGVLQVVLKLFNLTNPTNAYFGKKDAQQLYLLQNMVSSLFLKVNIVPCEIVREDDGLALSSRNVYLNKEERKEALKLSKALREASNLVIQKKFDVEQIQQRMREVLSPLQVDYAVVLKRDFTPISQVILGQSIVLVACRVGKTRLIDNLWI